ncbi:hypothetical protein HRG_006369 [Hirsutella rhossiliensis]|uniref:Uncharacterized protein n=1 Tax=Hirsutella rhossiliensis TaxID=111463 RepID=A0A9P8MVP8_9HYPO|nr:uncharacterized protein HRG_06369 [Hirsutella rhossiliensis]KAH0962267.1 hypothetical protein HRG_06369 [Hirsutella rhossiliensis]
MHTGCRKHELAYAKPRNQDELLKKTAEDEDPYTDVENATDDCARHRPKECWVYRSFDERWDDPKLKVLCWGDIDVWILRDPERDGGRDRPAMQRKTRDVIYKYHFDSEGKEELQKQLQGLREPEVKRDVCHVVPERTQVADILIDMDDDLPQKEIVQRMVEALGCLRLCVRVSPAQPTET